MKLKIKMKNYKENINLHFPMLFPKSPVTSSFSICLLNSPICMRVADIPLSFGLLLTPKMFRINFTLTNILFAQKKARVKK